MHAEYNGIIKVLQHKTLIVGELNIFYFLILTIVWFGITDRSTH